MMNDTVAGLETYEAAALEEELSGGLAFLPDDEFRGAAGVPRNPPASTRLGRKNER